MSKAKKTVTAEVSPLESIAVRLEAIRAEVEVLGESRPAKQLGYAIKSVRWADKCRAVRVKRVGSMIAALKAQGLTAEEIVSRLS